MLSEQNLTNLSIIHLSENCQLIKCKTDKQNLFICKKRYREEEKLTAYKEILINEKIKNLKNKNITKFYGKNLFQNDLFFEYATEGCLFDFYTVKMHEIFKENIFRNFNYLRIFLIQIIGALKKIHKLGIVHNDLKLENILIFKIKNKSKNVFNFFPKICDFNNSVLIKHQNEYSEIFEYNFNINHTIEIPSPETDYFNLGIIIYQLIFNQNPFDFPDVSKIKEKCFKENKNYQNFKNYILKDLIEKLLEYKANKRLNDDNILSHPFFNAKIMTKRRNKNIYIKKKILKLK